VITLHLPDQRSVAAWVAVLELARARPVGWTLIGAQMVALHAAEHGRPLPRLSADADLLADVRLATGATEALAEALLALGFTFLGATPDNVGHRFVRGAASVDLLAPDGLGSRASRTTVYPAHTVAVPGGTQALRRTQRVAVSVGGQEGIVPRPDLLGAILLKSRAVEVDDVPDSQRLDLALLLSLVPDPRRLAVALTPSERRWLRRRTELFDRQGSAWLRLGEGADDAYLALRILADR
jgi:hypothetical protein